MEILQGLLLNRLTTTDRLDQLRQQPPDISCFFSKIVVTQRIVNDRPPEITHPKMVVHIGPLCSGIMIQDHRLFKMGDTRQAGAPTELLSVRARYRWTQRPQPPNL
jgi:hypothetical protein